MPLLIYTPTINPRITYIFNHILVNILGIDYNFTTNQQLFIQFSDAKLNYSSFPFGDEIYLAKHPFIDEVSIEQQSFTFTDYEKYTVPFAIEDNLFPFDIFSAAFYLLSRYEEYLPNQKDSHGRYQAENSCAFTNNFLHLPVIDNWAFTLFAKLKTRYTNLKANHRQFTFIPTIDVDSPYFLKTETYWKKNLKIIKSVLKGNFGILKHDPFDTFKYIKNIHQQYNLQPLFFFLIGNKHLYDTAPKLSSHQKIYTSLIKSVSKYAKIGIHPSYQSNENIAALATEIKILASALSDKKIETSRQHYLKLTLPHTYNNLLNNGIKHDYTMGYASHTGFRASTCTPFIWYDLQNESITELTIHPLTVMDQTLKKYLNLSPHEAIMHTQKLIDEVIKVNGTFISLWHNETLSNFGGWNGWLIVYEKMLEYVNNINKQMK